MEQKVKQGGTKVVDEGEEFKCDVCGKGPYEGHTNFTRVRLGSGVKTMHKECFACAECQKGLSGGEFFEQDGKLICNKCADKKKKAAEDLNKATDTADICAKCEKYMGDDYVKAFGKTFHPECFCCDQCGNKIKGKCFPEGKKLFCSEECYRAAMTPAADAAADDGAAPDTSKCAKCGKAFTSSYMMFGDAAFHPECFTCDKCNGDFEGEVYTMGDQRLCKKCIPQ